MRAIIKDSQYRALKDPKDRKAAFEKFIDMTLQVMRGVGRGGLSEC